MLAAAVPHRLSLLKQRNAHGSHICIRMGNAGTVQKHTVSEIVLHVKMGQRRKDRYA